MSNPIQRVGFLNGYLDKTAVESFETQPGGPAGMKGESEKVSDGSPEDAEAAAAAQEQLKQRLHQHLSGA